MTIPWVIYPDIAWSCTNHDTKLPPSVIYATDYISLIPNKDQVHIINDFVADLEKSLQAKSEKVSFDALWDAFPPADANGTSLQEYMKDVGFPSFWNEGASYLRCARHAETPSFMTTTIISIASASRIMKSSLKLHTSVLLSDGSGKCKLFLGKHLVTKWS